MNAGNAFTTENYLGGITGSKYKNYPKPYAHKTYKELKDALDQKYGPKEAKKKLNIYANNQWTDQDFQNIKDMGMNTVRLPLNYINLTNYKKGMNPEDAKVTSHSFDAVDKFVQKAKAHGIYVNLDFHGAPNSQNGEEHSADTNKGNNVKKDENGNDKSWDGHLWEDDNSKGKGAQFGDDEVNQFYKEAIKSIRDTGDKHIIFLEGIWDPNNLKQPSYYNDTAHNLVYEYHNYPTKSDNSVRESFDKKLNGINKANYDVPSYLG